MSVTSFITFFSSVKYFDFVAAFAFGYLEVGMAKKSIDLHKSLWRIIYIALAKQTVRGFYFLLSKLNAEGFLFFTKQAKC